MPGREDTDVDPKEAFDEGKVAGSGAEVSTTGSQKTTPPDEGDVIDTLEPKAEPRTWVIKEGEIEQSYVQRPLSFFGKMQFFSLVGEVIDKAVSGEGGLRISSLFEAPGGRDGLLSAADFRDADTFVQGVGKLLTYAPDFLEKSYAIWLGVPDHERKWAISVMKKPKDQGGFSDEEGLEVIEVFIDQNWESLEDFFRKKIVTLRDRVQSHRPARQEEMTDE